MLSRDQREFDRNNDGRLSGFEWSDWYDYTFGIDETEHELEETAEAEERWSRWYNNVYSIIERAYNTVLSESQALFPIWDDRTRELTERTFYHWVTSGFLAGNLWNETWSAGAGMYTSTVHLIPYQSLIRNLSEEYPSCCSFSDITNSIAGGKPLFENEGLLVDERIGTYWEELLSVLPTYHEQPLAIFDCYCRISFPPGEDVKIDTLSRLLQSLFPMFTFFAGYSQVASDEKLKHFRECFEAHWKERGDTTPKLDDEPAFYEVAFHEELVNTFQDYFATYDWNDFCECSTASLLYDMYRLDPATGIEMWGHLIESTLSDGDTKELCNQLDSAFREVWELEEITPVLDELENESSPLWMVFRNPYMLTAQHRILIECADQHRTKLLSKLIEKMGNQSDPQGKQSLFSN